MKSLFIYFAFFYVSIGIVNSQSISDIRINPDGNFITYLKDRDSLFIKSFSANSSITLIDQGLKEDSNERLRLWNKANDKFIYDKDGSFYVYNIYTETKTKVPLNKKLRLFQFYLIDQTAIDSDDNLYFSADLDEKNEKFVLYKLNINDGVLTKIAEEDNYIANIAISPDESLIGYSHYYYKDGKIPYAGLKVINRVTGKVVLDKGLSEGVFYSSLSFSEDNQIAARNIKGGNIILKIGCCPNEFEEQLLDNANTGHFIQFVKNNMMLTFKRENGLKCYKLFNVLTNKEYDIIRGSNVSFVNIRLYKKSLELFYTKETGKLPKSLFKTTINNNFVTKSKFVSSFVTFPNPLNDIFFKEYKYINGDGKYSNAYMYLPSSWGSKKAIPLIIMVYGGYSNSYPNMDYFMNKIFFPLVDQGYALAFLNTRGVSNERRKNGYGKIQLEDTELFLSRIVERYPIDSNKIIVSGHSHGATMVYYYLTHSNRFAAGLSFNGAADWVKQAHKKSMTGLPYEMGGSPEELPEKYKEYSPIENITKTMNPMFIVSGGKDSQIPVSFNSKAFIDKTKKLNLQIDYLHFEEEGHLFLNPKNQKMISKRLNKFMRLIKIN